MDSLDHELASPLSPASWEGRIYGPEIGKPMKEIHRLTL